MNIVNNIKLPTNLEDHLHYDLSFLDKGAKWRPEKDQKRFSRYMFAKEQFELEPLDQLQALLPEGMLHFGSYDDFIHHTRILGYPRLLTLKTADMVTGQPPLITAHKDEAKSQLIRTTLNQCSFSAHLKKAIIDYSRFGVMLLKIFKDERGKGNLTVWDPNEWYPVFYADGTMRIKYNVIGWQFQRKLTVQIHNTANGSYEERVMDLTDDNRIGDIVSSKVYNKGSNKKLLFAITNTPTSTNPFGTNDYAIVNGLLQKAIQRLTAILRVLDEHADPSLTGPHSLLTVENGEKVFKTGKFYAVGKDEQKPEYLIWEANLESSFKAFSELCKQIYTLSEMGEAFLGASEGVGNVVSGTAMRFKLISPLEKARRIANELTEPVKEIVSSLLYIAGETLDPLLINTIWRDSLPKDPREVAELIRIESGAPAAKTLEQSIIDNYDLDRDSAEKFVEEIYTEQEFFRTMGQQQEDGINSEDGRSHSPTKVDPRKKGSTMDPASSENRGEDSKK